MSSLRDRIEALERKPEGLIEAQIQRLIARDDYASLRERIRKLEQQFAAFEHDLAAWPNTHKDLGREPPAAWQQLVREVHDMRCRIEALTGGDSAPTRKQIIERMRLGRQEHSPVAAISDEDRAGLNGNHFEHRYAEALARVDQLDKLLHGRGETILALRNQLDADALKIRADQQMIEAAIEFQRRVQDALGIGPEVAPLQEIEHLRSELANLRVQTLADKDALEVALRSDQELRDEIAFLRCAPRAECHRGQASDLRGTEVAGSPRLIPGSTTPNAAADAVTQGTPADWVES